MHLRVLFLLALAFSFVSPTVAAAQSGTSINRPSCILRPSASVVVLGGTVNLTWSSQYATYGTITTIGAVGPSGVQGVIPRPPSTLYTGVFYGPNGTTTCAVTITVSTEVGGSVVGGIDGAGNLGPVGTVDSPGTVTAPPTLQGQTPGAAPTLPSAGNITLSNTPGTGIVPCGKDGDVGGATGCEACHLAKLSQNIINFLIGLSIPLAAALFAWAGVLYFTSGVVGKIDKGRKIFTSVFIGFALMAGAWLIIQTILKTLLKDEYKNWSSITCVGSANRPNNASIATLINGAIPGLNTTQLPYVVGSGGGGSGAPWTCQGGYNYMENTSGEVWCQGPGGASDWQQPQVGGPVQSSSAGTCPSGYAYAENPTEGAWCQDLANPSLWKELIDSPTAGGSGTGPGGGSDATIRSLFTNPDNEISINKPNCATAGQTNCTSLDGLQNSALQGVLTINSNCDCYLKITGGTEAGHSTKGTLSHSNGYKVDFALEPALNAYLQGPGAVVTQRADGPTYTEGNRSCTRESNHWDCTFR